MNTMDGVDFVGIIELYNIKYFFVFLFFELKPGKYGH